MQRTEDGLLIDNETIKLSREILIAVGGVILLSKLINAILGIPYGTVVSCEH
jgi:hypothetical protein